MNKEFIPYEQALALKALGFSEECFGYFDEGEFYYTSNPWDATKEKGTMTNPTSAPTYSQGFKFFRDEYGLQKSICPNTENHNFYFFFHKDEGEGRVVTSQEGNGLQRGLYSNFNSYEEAELACLKKLIEIVKDGE